MERCVCVCVCGKEGSDVIAARVNVARLVVLMKPLWCLCPKEAHGAK